MSPLVPLPGKVKRMSVGRNAPSPVSVQMYTTTSRPSTKRNSVYSGSWPPPISTGTGVPEAAKLTSLTVPPIMQPSADFPWNVSENRRESDEGETSSDAVIFTSRAAHQPTGLARGGASCDSVSRWPAGDGEVLDDCGTDVAVGATDVEIGACTGLPGTGAPPPQPVTTTAPPATAAATANGRVFGNATIGSSPQHSVTGRDAILAWAVPERRTPGDKRALSVYACTISQGHDHPNVFAYDRRMTVRGYNRRERPAKPALSRESIVAAALDVVRREGAERVTMRQLAKELDTGPASLYVYVRDTDELHAAVLDELLGEVAALSLDGDWRTRLWTVLSAYRDVLYQHPGLARVALVSPLNGPNYLTIVDTVLGLLAGAGVPAGPAAWSVDLLLLVATANAVEHGTRRTHPDADRKHDALAETVRTISADTHPHIAAVRAELMSGTGESRSRWLIDTLLSGARTIPLPD